MPDPLTMSGIQSRRRRWGQTALVSTLALCLASLTLAMSARASTYFPQEMVCPVGGEKFKYMALGSISTWGGLPDGMPLGSGRFPTPPPICPGNQLVMYRDFKPDEIKRLQTLLASDEYKGLRTAGDTPYYLAYRTARMLGDAEAAWLLLQATWEAKNIDPAGEQARRYNSEFLSVASALPLDSKSLDAVAMKARAANAARELGQFPQAEALRSSITIAPDAGGNDGEAAENRKGWTQYLVTLAGPISRQDASREPIDMIGQQPAVIRCMAKELAVRYKQQEPAPLTAFEAEYCARPELAKLITEQRKQMTD